MNRCHDCGATTPHECPPHVPLGCPCGGVVVLGGAPAPTYTCAACGKVSRGLLDLVPAAAPRAERPACSVLANAEEESP